MENQMAVKIEHEMEALGCVGIQPHSVRDFQRPHRLDGHLQVAVEEENLRP